MDLIYFMYEKCLETFSSHQNISKSNLFSHEEIAYSNERKMWFKFHKSTLQAKPEQPAVLLTGLTCLSTTLESRRSQAVNFFALKLIRL